MDSPSAEKPIPLSPSRHVRRAIRALRVVVHIGLGFVISGATGALFFQNRLLPRQTVRWWLLRLTKVLNLEIHAHGVPVDAPALYVANHISWVDIAVLGGYAPVTFLAKSEVASWPLIGRLATAAGTLYIRRGKGEVRERARQIARHISEGRSVLAFPEGTSTDGTSVLKFHSPLFSAAADHGHTVQPVAIRYINSAGAHNTAVPFIGDDEFHTHLWRLLGEDRIRVEVLFLPPLQAEGGDHRSLAITAHTAVCEAMCGTPAGVPPPSLKDEPPTQG